ncbi:MAG: M28 family peptidase [Vicinamibacterales bacterium]|nr:M28 family peptidase [Vicinamibacterales bacterium]
MKRAVIVVVMVAGLALGGGAAQDVHLPALDRHLPPRVETIYRYLSSRVDPAAGMDVVRFMDQYWRLAGNEGFERSQQFIFDVLVAGSFADGRGDMADLPVARVWYEEFPNAGQGWSVLRSTLALAGPTPEVLLSRAEHRVTLAINSFSTDGPVRYRVVDVGRGVDAADYATRDVTGAVVLASGPVGPVWNQAVRVHGAAGVVSSDVAPYTRPDETPDILQWGSIPYDDQLRSFAFKATPRAAARLRERLAAGPVEVTVDIATDFSRRPNRTLVAEIPGRTRPDERVVLVAHVQEPGANDNASGSASLMLAALAMQRAAAFRGLPLPDRTLTFLWVDEIRGTEEWIRRDPARAGRVLAMMSLDMTGQDTAKTGGTFLIEKSPDPSALWDRPSDPHSEWGKGTVDPAWVRGHFLNDLHLAVSLRRARTTGWVVRTNPYEGGSDHTVFLRAGVPALLNWHFTDRYYHSNLDRPDKTSPLTMSHVATAVATTAQFLATAGAEDAEPLAALVEAAADSRFETERANWRALVAAAPDRAAAEAIERDVWAAWQRWYAEALESVAAITPEALPPAARARIDRATARIRTVTP